MSKELIFNSMTNSKSAHRIFVLAITVIIMAFSFYVFTDKAYAASGDILWQYGDTPQT